ncbi:hypothetical protein V1523DRAFT_294354 [Lipomyces doorenjongii]
MLQKRLRWRYFEGAASEPATIVANGTWQRRVSLKHARDEEHDGQASTSGRPVPIKRRVELACQNCRKRKSRCDGAKPRCRFCDGQGWECEYSDLPPIRSERNTRVRLDRIHSFQDRVFVALDHLPEETRSGLNEARYRTNNTSMPAAKADVNDSILEMPTKHSGNTMQVINWPIVTLLLTRAGGPESVLDPIYPFYVINEDPVLAAVTQVETFPSIASDTVWLYLTYYMREVHCFFPVLDSQDVEALFHLTSETEASSDIHCLLNVVLAFGALSATGKVKDESERIAVETQCWNASVMLLGIITMTSSVASIQAAALAGFYCGAQVKIFKCLKYLQTASTMSQIYIKRNIRHNTTSNFPHGFCCTFWCIYSYENDLLSELDFASSGLARYEDMVPYPSAAVDPMPIHLYAKLSEADGHIPRVVHEEIAICQIVTNASIRKAINRVTATIYSRPMDIAESSSNSRVSWYVDSCTWMVKYAREFEEHQRAMQEKIPMYMLTSPPNEEWNVNRLRRRKFALEYIIHRNFIEYVLHNPDRLAADPLRAEILEYCRRCLEGCKHFIESLASVRINILTGPFASGMATMTMVTTLLVSKTSHPLTAVLPIGVDTAIHLGCEMLIWLADVYPSFHWHADLVLRLKAQVDKSRGGR